MSGAALASPASPAPPDGGDAILGLLLENARTAQAWQGRDIETALLRRLYEAAKLGPTSFNCSPLRILFLRSPEAKAKLAPALQPGNLKAAMSAPVVAVFATDQRYYERLPELFPTGAGLAQAFAGNTRAAWVAGFRNATLQAAYAMLAARALGLDIGPISGFDPAMVDSVFFPDGRCRSNFLCSLGYADRRHEKPRLPRLAFEDACQVL